ncbi:hypothetical protein ACQUFY_26375 (plasmid) [Robbsia andropogonis]|uniref:hypothetical protein n=1 Tax=Robbsia andropogonis TaxID=28092 RepID=UPI003D204A62
MGFAIYPVFVICFILGLIAQMTQQADAVPGAGIPGAMENRAQQRAKAAEVYAAACVEAAFAVAGEVSSAISVTAYLPAGTKAPSNSGCLTTSASSGRNVYAYVPTVAGVAGLIRKDTDEDLSWYRVSTSGIGINLVTGSSAAISTSIPTGTVVKWVVANS